MEKGLLNRIVLLDLRKTFNLVATDLLLQKVSVNNVTRRNLIAWLKSYLQHRQQCVQFNCKISDTKPVTYGVPQESILGPLLFIFIAFLLVAACSEPNQRGPGDNKTTMAQCSNISAPLYKTVSLTTTTIYHHT